MKRLNIIKPTEAMRVDVMAKSLPGRVYNLAAGDPNLKVCDAVKQAYLNADPDDTHNYGASIGMPALRDKIWPRPEEVIIANGAKQLIYMSLAAVTHPGDEVVTIGPCWASYMRICDILGLKCRLLIGNESERYVPCIEDVTAAITRDTAAVLINNPNNPTGIVYPDEYMDAVLAAVRENNTYLICDEIYGCLTEKPFKSLRGEKDVIVIDGFSKSLSVTGWRLGYAIGEREIISAMAALQSQMSGPPSTLIQKIFNTAWEKLEYASYDDYKARIDVLCRIPKFAAARPQGGFYFFVPIDKRWESTQALADYMLRKYSIAITPGDDYGVERTVRISVASETKEALEEIVTALGEI